MRTIDWTSPWLVDYGEIGREAASLALAGVGVAAALNQAARRQPRLGGWQFVPQEQLPLGMAYEAFIHERRSIPTRDNLHDFFNGLVWLRWPCLKQRLNQLQAQAIAEQEVARARGPLRDAITVFDENGALLLAPATMIEALRAREWKRLFIELRPLWRHARLLPVGHALLEKLTVPRKPITAHLLCVATDEDGGPAQPGLGEVDTWLAQSHWLQAGTLAQKPFSPLPVLGVPGWWAPNQDFCFYDDPFVFRAPRTAQPAQQPGGASDAWLE